jgi:microcin C transport system substrate-binding protein
MALATRAIVVACLFFPAATFAQDWTNGIAVIGKLKYPPGFDHFDYVNLQAPKAGNLRTSQLGTFDTLNPVLAKGNTASNLGLVFDTLLKPALDEPDSAYGLVAEAMRYPDDFSSVSFRLNPSAKFADGQPVTPEDVLYSFDKARDLDPQKTLYYQHVTGGKKTGEHEVTFTFDQKNNRELPAIMGQLLILPKHWWEGTDKSGKKRDISATTQEPVMGSGPYEIAAVNPGSTITFKLRDDYWGKDLPVNKGYNNFRTITDTYFPDRDVEFEAFRGGDTDYWWENSAKRWATAYDFPAVKQGNIKREVLPNDYRSTGVMVGFIPNLRRDKFRDERVREALNYALDFEELNRTIFYMQYQRINSYFYGSELASSGLPQGKELELLNSIKDLVPPSVFTEEYKNPVGGNPKKFRENLKAAVGLFKQAGYEIRGNKMVNTKTGEPYSFEIMLDTPIIEKVALPFAQNLKKIGVTVNVRSVDSSQFTERWRKRDFDMIYQGWSESINPGNEQAEYWGSQSAAREGTQNYAGISDKGVDFLINKVIFAPTRDEQIVAVKALDRVLLHHHYVVPSYSRRALPVAYSSKLAHPDKLPEYSSAFPSIWWMKQ